MRDVIIHANIAWILLRKDVAFVKRNISITRVCKNVYHHARKEGFITTQAVSRVYLV